MSLEKSPDTSKKRSRDIEYGKGLAEKSKSCPDVSQPMESTPKKSKKSHKKSKSVSFPTTKVDEQRSYVIREILTTEKSYIDCLHLAIKVSRWF